MKLDRRHPPRQIPLFISFFFFLLLARTVHRDGKNTIKEDRNLKEKKVFLSFFSFTFIIFSLSLSLFLQSFKNFYRGTRSPN